MGEIFRGLESELAELDRAVNEVNSRLDDARSGSDHEAQRAMQRLENVRRRLWDEYYRARGALARREEGE